MFVVFGNTTTVRCKYCFEVELGDEVILSFTNFIWRTIRISEMAYRLSYDISQFCNAFRYFSSEIVVT